MTGQIQIYKRQSGRESGGGMGRVRTRTWVACSTTAPHAVVLPTRHQLAQTFKVLALRWPRELNALQLEKTHANRKSSRKSRKHFHHFDSRWCKCSQHNQINFICSAFLFWLCCEHLQRVRCQIDESVFLICRCFFLFAARFFFWLCCEHLQRVHC